MIRGGSTNFKSTNFEPLAYRVTRNVLLLNDKKCTIPKYMAIEERVSLLIIQTYAKHHIPTLLHTTLNEYVDNRIE